MYQKINFMAVRHIKMWVVLSKEVQMILRFQKTEFINKQNSYILRTCILCFSIVTHQFFSDSKINTDFTVPFLICTTLLRHVLFTSICSFNSLTSAFFFLSFSLLKKSTTQKSGWLSYCIIMGHTKIT